MLEHMEAENAHDFERCIAMFAHPRYEIIATGEVWDGHSGVNALLQENKKGFPDFRFHPESFHHSAEAVIVEGSAALNKSPKLRARFSRIYEKKYKFDMSTMKADILSMKEPVFAVRPLVVFGLPEKQFQSKSTRWKF